MRITSKHHIEWDRHDREAKTIKFFEWVVSVFIVAVSIICGVIVGVLVGVWVAGR